LMAQSRRSGVALSTMEAFFAATALAKNLRLVTPNVKDFESFGVALFNPWAEWPWAFGLSSLSNPAISHPQRSNAMTARSLPRYWISSIVFQPSAV
jgi:hypothetical protein